ncbi:MAG: hypothetical protein ABJN36_13640 [Cyclobacteriaceae bacterium]
MNTLKNWILIVSLLLSQLALFGQISIESESYSLSNGGQLEACSGDGDNLSVSDGLLAICDP